MSVVSPGRLRMLVFFVAVGGVSLAGAGCGESTGTPGGGPDAGAHPLDAGRPERPSTGDLTSPANDAGAAPTPLACPPSPTRFVPTAYVPAVAHQGVCSAADIANFVTACVDPGVECPTWSETNHAGFLEGGTGTPCGRCLFAPENNGGLWIDPENLFDPNYAGCIQLLDPTFGPACAVAFEDVLGCQALACEYCPNFSSDDFSDCVALTAKEGCASYLAKANAACNSASGAFETCTSGTGGSAPFVRIATLICGAGPADGGAD